MRIIALIGGRNGSKYGRSVASTYTKGVSESYTGAYIEKGGCAPPREVLHRWEHIAEPLGSGGGPAAGVLLDVVDNERNGGRGSIEDACVSCLPDAPCGEDDERGKAAAKGGGGVLHGLGEPVAEAQPGARKRHVGDSQPGEDLMPGLSREDVARK